MPGYTHLLTKHRRAVGRPPLAGRSPRGAPSQMPDTVPWVRETGCCALGREGHPLLAQVNLWRAKYTQTQTAHDDNWKNTLNGLSRPRLDLLFKFQIKRPRGEVRGLLPLLQTPGFSSLAEITRPADPPLPDSHGLPRSHFVPLVPLALGGHAGTVLPASASAVANGSPHCNQTGGPLANNKPLRAQKLLLLSAGRGSAKGNGLSPRLMPNVPATPSPKTESPPSMGLCPEGTPHPLAPRAASRGWECSGSPHTLLEWGPSRPSNPSPPGEVPGERGRHSSGRCVGPSFRNPRAQSPAVAIREPHKPDPSSPCGARVCQCT